MKLWLDDERDPPDETWERVCTVVQALEYLFMYWDEITHISFDHDMGDGDAIIVARLIEALAANFRGYRLEWSVHSANPVGAKNVVVAMQSAEKYWQQMEDMNV